MLSPPKVKWQSSGESQATVIGTHSGHKLDSHGSKGHRCCHCEYQGTDPDVCYQQQLSSSGAFTEQLPSIKQATAARTEGSAQSCSTGS